MKKLYFSLHMHVKPSFAHHLQAAKMASRVKKSSLLESLAKSHAYNSIRNSGQDAWRARKVSARVSPRVPDWIICMTLAKTLSETSVVNLH